MIPANENKNICSACQGGCCKNVPGTAFPEQFPTAASVITAVNTGQWTIDWWEGDPRIGRTDVSIAYFIRPAVKGHEGQRYHPSFGGECTFLTPTGCSLSIECRPYECLEVVPVEGGFPNCKSDAKYEKRQAAIAWLDRTDDLEAAM
jgi:hypothetical protein